MKSHLDSHLAAFGSFGPSHKQSAMDVKKWHTYVHQLANRWIYECWKVKRGKDRDRDDDDDNNDDNRLRCQIIRTSTLLWLCVRVIHLKLCNFMLLHIINFVKLVLESVFAWHHTASLIILCTLNYEPHSSIRLNMS